MAEMNTETIKRQDKGLSSLFARLTDLVDAKLELLSNRINKGYENSKRRA
jgi:hypothetical protein